MPGTTAGDLVIVGGPSTPPSLPAGALLLGLFALVACSDAPPPDAGAANEEPSQPVTVYSGRSEALIAPLLERFTAESGIEVRVRSGSTSEMTATLLEEGARTPADAFISQDAAALGALSRSEMLRPLPDELLRRVDSRFRSERGDWVGLSGRARSVVYNTERIGPDALPRSLAEVGQPRYRGRFGVAPGNASFQAHLACYGAVNGAEAAKTLIGAIVANEPLRYAKNTPIVEAVISGEIDWGLVNHYYLLRALRERPDAPARNFFMSGSDCSGFVNIAGVGLLSDAPQALRLVEFLLSDGAQRYFAEETFEYPLTGGGGAAELPPLDSLAAPDLDFGRLAESLEPTLQAIHAAGLGQF